MAHLPHDEPNWFHEENKMTREELNLFVKQYNDIRPLVEKAGKKMGMEHYSLNGFLILENGEIEADFLVDEEYDDEEFTMTVSFASFDEMLEIIGE